MVVWGPRKLIAKNWLWIPKNCTSIIHMSDWKISLGLMYSGPSSNHAQTQLVARCSWITQTFEWRVQKLGEVWIWYIIYMKWMVGKRSQISRLIRGRALTLFCLPLPVDVPSSSRHVTSRQLTYRRDETHKAEQPPRRGCSVTKVMFDELRI